MSTDSYAPSIFETNNARHKTPMEVARSFVPPANIFEELATKNNNVMVGPRGSGKTTLLKMLTLPALSNWREHESNVVLPKVSFIGVFIPADNGWKVQINGAGDNDVSIGAAAFTTHVLMAFVNSLLDIKKGEDFSALMEIPTVLNAAQEARFVETVAETWKLKPLLLGFEGLKLSLRKRLSELGELKKLISLEAEPQRYLVQHAPYINLNFKDCISFGVDAYEAISSNSRCSWGLLFDEFEIAPLEIQNKVFDSMRGEEDGRLLFKMALAPYNESFNSHFTHHNSASLHDYKVINLWHPDKKTGTNFSRDLLRRMIVSEGLNGDVSSLFDVSFSGDEDADAYRTGGHIVEKFRDLCNVDPDFKKYFQQRNLEEKFKNWSDLTENERAGIRKLRSIVIMRLYFLKGGGEQRGQIQKRSRKTADVYAGYPTILEICEGNPRTLINLFVPLLRQLTHIREGHAHKKLGFNVQADGIRHAANSFRALLKTIEYDDAKNSPSRSLLKLLDLIGEYFQEQSLGNQFHPEPNLSFTVPSHPNAKISKALGKALNAGAIIYVPDAKGDPLVGSLSGKRFRLNYLLATYYHLPIMLNAAVSLDAILSNQLNPDVNTQQSLFKDEEDRG